MRQTALGELAETMKKRNDATNQGRQAWQSRRQKTEELIARSQREDIGTDDVAVLTGVSIRQLQWWDEIGYVKPRRKGHARLYSPELTNVVMRIAQLRKRGVGLKLSIKTAKAVKDGTFSMALDAIDLLTRLKLIDLGKR